MAQTPPKNPTITDYVKYNRKSFSESPFSNVDSMILSTASFLCFERGIMRSRDRNERLPLPMALCGVRREELFGNNWLNSYGGDDFLTAFIESPRFMELSVGRVASESNDDADKQFGAVTFYLPENSVYVAFRGTDGSINGWREDFNLCFMCQVPSQVAARHYLEEVAATKPAHLYVGGYSKGGNLAEYASLTCSRICFEQISRIFNHDGPGFSVVPSKRYFQQDYLDKVDKTVPGNAIVGMLMEDRSIMKVVDANGIFIKEHASTNWRVNGDEFSYLPGIDKDAQIVYTAMNNWAFAYEPQQRAQLVKAAFDILESTDATTIGELDDELIKNLFSMRKACKALPQELRNELSIMLKDMKAALKEQTKSTLRSKK